MSYHLDKAEWDELVIKEEWDALWSAYQYAVSGGESSAVDDLSRKLSHLRARHNKLVGVVRDWFDGRCPISFDHLQHLAEPTVNCVTILEQKLAVTYVALIGDAAMQRMSRKTGETDVH